MIIATTLDRREREIESAAEKNRKFYARHISDDEIANIIFNETRSLSGAGIDDARVKIAHAIINAIASPHKFPKMAPTKANPPPVEKGVHAACIAAVQSARANVRAGNDLTSGATHFNFRRNNTDKTPFQGHALKTTVGPFANSHPTDELPASGIYSNTYE